MDRLELMATENLSVTAAFNMSYADLTGDQQRLFRRLGLHPGADIDAYAAAALDGTDLAAARRGLEGLYDQYLIAEPAQGRYRLHDLIREHARALAGRLDPDRDRDGATARLLDYYQHTAARAGALIARQTRPALAPADGAIPAAVPALAGQEQALAWARAERRQPARLPGPRHRYRPARPGHRSDRRPGRAVAARRPVGRRHHPAHQPRSRPHGISATGSARPTPSATSGTSGG